MRSVVVRKYGMKGCSALKSTSEYIKTIWGMGYKFEVD